MSAERPSLVQPKEVKEAFEAIYSVSFEHARQLSLLPNEIGKHWIEVFNYLKSNPQSQHEHCSSEKNELDH